MQIHSINFSSADTIPAKRESSVKETAGKINEQKKAISVYGDNDLRAKPAQLSLFTIHDFHGQNIRMERASSIAEAFSNNTLFKKNNNFFNPDMPVDKLILGAGDIFLGENEQEVRVVNEFLNIIGAYATAIGNHECDTHIDIFSELVKNKKYKFLGANMHPDKDNSINKILSKSFIIESNGNKYGLIGLVPSDMPNHMKRPEETVPFNISNFENTKQDLQEEINNLKKQGINKIIVLSHMGFDEDKKLAEKVSDIDVIIGGHTHTLLKDAKFGENLISSPKGEPVLIVQTGRDGKFVGLPNIQFNNLGQIEKVQYNIAETDKFERSLVTRYAFEKILGKPEVVGHADFVENPPKDIYASENPHCDFILDCLKSELGVDIAIMNSANIRGTFTKGEIDTRDLRLISPFANNVAIIKATEEELVNSIKTMIKKTSNASNHRPGILQVSGLKYEFSLSDGELKSLTYIDKNGKEQKIDINNPNSDKFYTIVADDYCIKSSDAGMNLGHRLDTAVKFYHCDKDKFVADYLKKSEKPAEIRSDGRIKSLP